MAQHQNDFENWELDKLSDHIINSHHSYVRNAIPSIQKNNKKVVEKYKSEYPEVVEISQIFESLSKALEEHLAGEEKYLFPYITKMLKAKDEAVKLPKPGFGSLEEYLPQHHVKNHADAAKLMQQIHELSKGFHLPKGADDTFAALYNQLSDFEKDLKQHIHLEDDILFGKSIELEKEVVE